MASKLLITKTSSSGMAERPRDALSDFKGWVILKLNFRLKGYVSRHIYGTLDGGMVTLQFAAGSFHTKKLVADFIRLKLNFIKTTTIAFGATLWGT